VDRNYQNSTIEEDEIDLRELLSTIWRGKLFIALFTLFVTTAVLLHLISTPNSYSSSVVLSPSEESSSRSLGGLSALAGFAGVDLSSGNSVDVGTLFGEILKDYSFTTSIIKRHNLGESLQNIYKSHIYPLGIEDSLLYNFSSPFKDLIESDREYKVYSDITDMLNISSDKKSGLITISATSTDREFSKRLVDIFLLELVERLREIEMRDIEKKLQFYEDKLQKSGSVELKQLIGKTISGLLQKQVLAEANELYRVSLIVDSRVAHLKEKVKPKRGLILAVTVVTSIILSIFIIFFREFLRGSRE
jgi:uncharacterized protein involved in exopolysaccharide biosynthesis